MNHILIIEDDPDIRESLRILLESENFLITKTVQTDLINFPQK